MSLHRFEFVGLTQEWGEMEIDVDPSLNDDEKIDLAMDEIRDLYPDYFQIEIEKVEEL